MSELDATVVKSLKALDPNRPIREADIAIVLNEVPLLRAKQTFQF